MVAHVCVWTVVVGNKKTGIAVAKIIAPLLLGPRGREYIWKVSTPIPRISSPVTTTQPPHHHHQRLPRAKGT